MTKILKIASVSAEVDPFSKSGGLGDVARSLPKALKKIGHEIIVITPLYKGKVDIKKHGLKKILTGVSVIIDNKHKEKVDYWQGELANGLPVYFVANEKYFGERKYLYDSSSPDENRRFVFFNIAVLKLLIKLNFQADIIHCNDWQTGLIPYFLKNDFKNSKTLKNTATVYTIHNLTFQLGHNWWQVHPDLKDSGRNILPDFEDPKIEGVNFAKRGILYADVINAVSEQYAGEIMTKKFGEDLHRILKNRKDRVFGIVNGIDYKDYNPEIDPGLHQNYTWRNFNEAKIKNKACLQKMFGLPVKKNVPIIGMVTRVTEQKGFDLIKAISDIIFRFNLQIIVIGSGDKKYMKSFKEVMKKHPKKFYANFKFIDTKDTTKIYAGCDMNLIPSRFEPCGVIQMIAMRYGTIPIVRHVGGLIDTVDDYDPRHQTGSGFVFKPYDPRSLAIAISRALETYKRPDEWKNLIKKVMRQSFSWEYPAQKYIELFQTALKNKKQDKN